jgi:hypothetical protein
MTIIARRLLGWNGGVGGFGGVYGRLHAGDRKDLANVRNDAVEQT